MRLTRTIERQPLGQWYREHPLGFLVRNEAGADVRVSGTVKNAAGVDVAVQRTVKNEAGTDVPVQ